MAKIKVYGKDYKVTATFPFQQVGMYAKQVETEDGYKVAVRPRGGSVWRWWIAEDKIRPSSKCRGM